jgi:hypothetical protein
VIALPENVPPAGEMVNHGLLLPACQTICPPPALARVNVLVEIAPGTFAPKSICLADNCNFGGVSGAAVETGCVEVTALLSRSRYANMPVANRNERHEASSKIRTMRLRV